MSLITLDSIKFKNNPAMFSQSINLQVTFTLISKIQHPLQWKIIYVGSALSQQHDQILQEFEIGPFQQQNQKAMKFNIECEAPDARKIPLNQLLSVTALILTVSYKEQEFIRVGYYVHNHFLAQSQVQNNQYPILPILIAGTKRTILADKPRVTIFNMNYKRLKQKQTDSTKYNSNTYKINSQREKYNQISQEKSQISHRSSFSRQQMHLGIKAEIRSIDSYLNQSNEEIQRFFDVAIKQEMGFNKKQMMIHKKAEKQKQKILKKTQASPESKTFFGNFNQDVFSISKLDQFSLQEF